MAGVDEVHLCKSFSSSLVITDDGNFGTELLFFLAWIIARLLGLAEHKYTSTLYLCVGGGGTWTKSHHKLEPGEINTRVSSCLNQEK